MNDDAVITLIRRHLHRYPESHFRDVYKLLHQAAFGPGHAIRDKAKVLEWIERDLEIEPATGVPFVESIHPADAMVRVHLHPYAAHGGSLRKLGDAFTRSANATTGAPEAMARWWAVCLEVLRDEDLQGFGAREASLFGRAMAAGCWPAEHHSPAYRETYRPAYRVLTTREAERLCEDQDIPFTPV